MVIDFHTHIFPDKIAEKTVRILEQNILSVEGTAHFACLSGTLDDLKKSMKINKIDLSVVLPIATTVTQSATINNFAADITGKDGIISFGSIHPMQENWEEELERISELGLLGIKLHPEYQGFYIDGEESIRVLKKAEKLGLCVVLHTGFDIGIAPPVHCMPERLARVLSHIEGNNIVAAHMGGYRAWDDAEKYIAGTPIVVDTSYSIEEMGEDLFLRILDKHGIDKVVFGTDSPWKDQGKTVQCIRELNLSMNDYEKIMYKNAEKILKINY
ncbi:MAG: amidohydrolase family protein [Clostridia bacterium]|nr:amidohydrolase family protein [Clostridia bacterium]